MLLRDLDVRMPEQDRDIFERNTPTQKPDRKCVAEPMCVAADDPSDLEQPSERPLPVSDR